jgi:hypothetical protein
MKKTIEGKVSLVLAITGHRDLDPDDYGRLETQIGNIFSELGEKYPATPLLLLSGLAEGADRIAVRAAKAKTIPYIAVLPMTVESYRKDFENPSSKVEFDELLSGADRCIELPTDDEFTPDETGQLGKARDEQYVRLGRYLVQYSQILIAIWDGSRTTKVGGTSHVVVMKLREEPSTEIRNSAWRNWNGAGPVYVLPARRVRSKHTMPPALLLEIRCPEGSKWEEFDASYRLLDQFNREPVRPQWGISGAVKKSRGYLFEGAEAIGLTNRMDWVARIYSVADALAIRYANLSLCLWQAVFFLAAISGIALAMQDCAQQGDPVFLTVYGGCFTVALLLMCVEPLARLRRRHEDYRGLAEALRVQFFWIAAGLRDVAAEQYLPKQSGEMAWIRDAISECALYSPAPVENHPLRLRLAHQWVKGQAKYFSDTFRSHGGKKKRLDAVAYAASAIGIAAPFAQPILRFFGWTVPIETSHTIAAIALWCGALTWHYIERRGFAQEARQYARMYELFHDADRVLEAFERKKDWAGSEETIRSLGREALEENGDWLSTHRERRLRLDDVTG